MGRDAIWPMAIIMQAHCLLPTTYCPPPTRVRTTYYSLWRSSCRPASPLTTLPPYHLRTTLLSPSGAPANCLPPAAYYLLRTPATCLLLTMGLLTIWPISSQSRAGPHEHRRCRDRDLPPAAQGVGGRHGASMGPMHESFLTLPLSPPTQPYPLPYP